MSSDTEETLEFVHFTVAKGQETEIVAKRGAMIEALGALPGFVGADLVRLDDGTWLDLVRWGSLQQAKAAAELSKVEGFPLRTTGPSTSPMSR